MSTYTEAVMQVASNSQLLEISFAAVDLIEFVIDKYEIQSVDEFTCPLHKKLYLSIWENGKESK